MERADNVCFAIRSSSGHTRGHATCIDNLACIEQSGSTDSLQALVEITEAISEGLLSLRIMESVSDDRKQERDKQFLSCKVQKEELRNAAQVTAVSFPGKIPQEFKPTVHKHP